MNDSSKDSFTILAIKVANPTKDWYSNCWVLTDEKDVNDLKIIMAEYYSNFSKHTENPFDEDFDPYNYDKFQKDLLNDSLFGIKDLEKTSDLSILGNYMVSNITYSHHYLDSYSFYNFNKIN
jgi:hypothetical protein